MIFSLSGVDRGREESVFRSGSSVRLGQRLKMGDAAMNATVMTVPKFTAIERLIYASGKGMPCPMKT